MPIHSRDLIAFMRTELRCGRCDRNKARYLDAEGLFTCGICPVIAGVPSIRFIDVPWERAMSAPWPDLTSLDLQEARRQMYVWIMQWLNN